MAWYSTSGTSRLSTPRRIAGNAKAILNFGMAKFGVTAGPAVKNRRVAAGR
jgi:hypothetical protein